MDEEGVRTAILSQFPPYHLSTAARRKALARGLNEAAARHAIDYPGRFGLFTSLPLPSIDDCLEEIEYGFDVLGADGVAMSTRIDGKWESEERRVGKELVGTVRSRGSPKP